MYVLASQDCEKKKKLPEKAKVKGKVILVHSFDGFHP